MQLLLRTNSKELTGKDEASLILIRLEDPEESMKFTTILRKETTLTNVKTCRSSQPGWQG